MAVAVAVRHPERIVRGIVGIHLGNDIDSEAVLNANAAGESCRGSSRERSSIPVTCSGQKGMPKSLKQRY